MNKENIWCSWWCGFQNQFCIFKFIQLFIAHWVLGWLELINTILYRCSRVDL